MLLYLFCFLSILLSAFTCWLLPVRNAWLIPISIGFFLAYLIGILLLTALYLLISSLLLPKKEPPPKKSGFGIRTVKLFCPLICQIGRIRPFASGLDKIPEGPFLLVSNHRSNLDPILTVSLLRRSTIAFLTKASNMKIPIAGPYIRLADYLTIDRENPRNAIKTIHLAAELIQRDQISFGVYPEGTRNFTEEPLLPFHEGVFMIAQKAHVPIVVVALKDTELVHKRFPLHATTVSFDVLHVYPADEVRSRRTKELSDEVRDQILRHLSSGKSDQ